MRKLIAWVFIYSRASLLARRRHRVLAVLLCLPVDPADLKPKLDVYQGA